MQATNNVNGAYTRFAYSSSMMWIEQFSTIQDGAGEAFSIQVLDGAGRVRATAHDHPTGTSGPTPYSGSFVVYDNMGRVVQQSNAAETNSSVEITSQWIASGDDASNGWVYTTQAYDWKGRPTVTTNPDNTTRVMSYGGCGCAGGELVTAQDEAGRLRRTTADVFGRLAKVEELSRDASVYSTTNYAYDVLDHLTSLNQQGLPRSFGFDGFGRLQTRTTPEQGTTTYTYFADDTVQTVTDARNATSTFAYNGRHLATGITYGVPGGVAATANVSFGYDAAGNRTSMNDGPGSVSYGYDQLSRVTSETRNFNGVGSFALNYNYNLAGELTSITNPWGAQVEYSYDKVGETTNISGAGYAGISTYASGITYRAFGAIKGMTYGNGLSLTTAYDTRLRLSSFNVSGVQAYNYSYLEQTTRANYVRNLNDSTLDRSYEFDDVGRLVFAHSGAEARAAFGIDGQQWGTMDGPYSLGFNYDQFGNMAQRYGWGGEVQGGGAGQTSYLNYSYTNNRRDGFSYDAAGNLTNDLGQNFIYDATGQQTSASYSGYSLQQVYDGDGLRAMKNDNGSATYYLRSTVLGGQVVAEMNGGGGWIRGYVYQGSSLLAIQYGGVYWVHEDPITKSKRITDSADSVVSASELDPWGGDTGRSWSQYFQPHRFNSYERDTNQSDEAMFRRYNRWHSRYDQPDPYDGSYDWTDPQSLNRYAYTQGDPVNFTDKTGLDGEGDCGTWQTDPATGEDVWIPCSTNVVTVKAGWDDMSDYLPDWGGDDMFIVYPIIIGFGGGPGGGGPIGGGDIGQKPKNNNTPLTPYQQKVKALNDCLDKAYADYRKEWQAKGLGPFDTAVSAYVAYLPHPDDFIPLSLSGVAGWLGKESFGPWGFAAGAAYGPAKRMYQEARRNTHDRFEVEGHLKQATKDCIKNNPVP
jgi:RHS repeat-associated protein